MVGFSRQTQLYSPLEHITQKISRIYNHTVAAEAAGVTEKMHTAALQLPASAMTLPASHPQKQRERGNKVGCGDLPMAP